MAHTRGKRKDDWTLEIFLIFNVEQLSIKKKKTGISKRMFIYIFSLKERINYMQFIWIWVWYYRCWNFKCPFQFRNKIIFFFLIKDSHIVALAQMVKNLLTMRAIWIQSPGGEEPLEKEMATLSSILVRRIPWTEEPGRL